MDGRPLIHVGLSKTGSTTLQRQLFASHPDIHYLGKYVGKTVNRCVDDASYEVLEKVIKNSDAPFDRWAAVGLLRERLLPTIPRDKCVVGSWEGLGNLATEAYVEMLRYVRSVFGETRVMMVLRNPLSRLNSCYLQNLQGRFIRGRVDRLGRDTCADIEKWYERRRARNGYRVLLNYGECVRASVDNLGRRNVGVFLFEDLKEDPERYYRSVCEFIGIDPDLGVSLAEGKHLSRSLGQRQVDYIRRMSSSRMLRLLASQGSQRCRREALARRAGDPPAKVALTSRLVEEVTDATRDDHRWMADVFRLPLERYGYPLG